MCLRWSNCFIDVGDYCTASMGELVFFVYDRHSRDSRNRMVKRHNFIARLPCDQCPNYLLAGASVLQSGAHSVVLDAASLFEECYAIIVGRLKSRTMPYSFMLLCYSMLIFFDRGCLVV